MPIRREKYTLTYRIRSGSEFYYNLAPVRVIGKTKKLAM